MHIIYNIHKRKLCGGIRLYVKYTQSYMVVAGTDDFILKVLGVYTRSMETIYLSMRAQVAVGTFFMKSPVVKNVKKCIWNFKTFDKWFNLISIHTLLL